MPEFSQECKLHSDAYNKPTSRWAELRTSGLRIMEVLTQTQNLILKLASLS